MHNLMNNSVFSINPVENLYVSTDFSDLSDVKKDEENSITSNSLKNCISTTVVDQEKGLERDKDISKNESTLLINKDITYEKKEKFKNLEVENKQTINPYIRLKHYGNTFPMFFNKSGEPIIVIGPHCKKYFFK